MPKYTVIWQNKKRSKYASFFNISDAAEFCVTLAYSESWHNENSKHIQNPVK